MDTSTNKDLKSHDDCLTPKRSPNKTEISLFSSKPDSPYAHKTSFCESSEANKLMGFSMKLRMLTSDNQNISQISDIKSVLRANLNTRNLAKQNDHSQSMCMPIFGTKLSKFSLVILYLEVEEKQTKKERKEQLNSTLKTPGPIDSSRNLPLNEYSKNIDMSTSPLSHLHPSTDYKNDSLDYTQSQLGDYRNRSVQKVFQTLEPKLNQHRSQLVYDDVTLNPCESNIFPNVKSQKEFRSSSVYKKLPKI